MGQDGRGQGRVIQGRSGQGRVGQDRAGEVGLTSSSVLAARHWMLIVCQRGSSTSKVTYSRYW